MLSLSILQEEEPQNTGRMAMAGDLDSAWRHRDSNKMRNKSCAWQQNARALWLCHRLRASQCCYTRSLIAGFLDSASLPGAAFLALALHPRQTEVGGEKTCTIAGLRWAAYSLDEGTDHQQKRADLQQSCGQKFEV